MKRMIRRATFVWALTLLVPCLVHAQSGTVSGVVTEAESGEVVPGVNVVLEGTQTGTASNADGFFTFDAPAGEYTLAASFVGYETFTAPVTVTAGETTEVEVEMTSDLSELDEVVVTGVSVGTSTRKTAFAVSKVSEEDLEKVPGTDPASALRAKAPGVRVVQPSGRPGSSPEIRLRGSKTISGDQSPLIVVDGAITSGSLQDIDMQAVQSIEVIKGSAASSLYGSLGANGVVQVITKRGADNVGQTRITLRNEFGFTDLANQIDLATHHGFETDADADNGFAEGQYRAEATGINEAGVPRSDDNIYILDNDYNTLINQQEALFANQPFMTNFVSVTSRQQNLNYLVSFENLLNSGVVEGLDPYRRRNVRLNVDNQATDWLNLSASGLYSNSDGVDNNTILGQGQGSNVFYGVLLAEPDLQLNQPATDPDTGEEFEFNPFIAGGNSENPLYVASTREIDVQSERFLGNLRADVALMPWWNVNGQFSYDKENEGVSTYVPRGTRFAASPPSSGSLFKGNFEERVAIADVRSIFSGEFSDLNANFTLGYTYEDRTVDNATSSGSNFRVRSVPQLDNLDPEQLSSASFSSTVQAENFLGNLQFDYRDRYGLDMVLRRDGLSLFGQDVRYQTYYRVGSFYRLTEDFSIPSVDELKLRASYGTSGLRPPFQAQYETYNVLPVGVVKNVLGNAEIEPSTLKELELGIDAQLFGRFFLQANYADAISEDQFLLVPLSASAGYGLQWQNAGDLASETIEVGLSGTALERDDYSVSFSLNFDRTRQEITRLTRPQYTVGTQFGAAIDAFRIQEGVPFGAIYGNELATSVDELTVGEDGTVVGSVGTYGEELTPEDFTVNSDGYVIKEGTQYTADENAMYIYNDDGTKAVNMIGNATPDFNVGFGATLNYKNFQFYGLLDWEQGGDVYNYSRQNLYFNSRHGDLDQSDRQTNIYECVEGNPSDNCAPVEGNSSGIAEDEQGNQILLEGNQRWGTYYEGQLYNGSSPSSEFVEDASYVKVREISLTYSFTNNLLSKIGVGNALYDAKLSLSGRNLFTFTGYSGFDPEVAVDAGGANPTNFRIEEYGYPNFRTYAVSLQVRL